MTEEIRWHYRFRNFSRAFTLLREALEGDVEALSQLEREASCGALNIPYDSRRTL